MDPGTLTHWQRICKLYISPGSSYVRFYEIWHNQSLDDRALNQEVFFFPDSLSLPLDFASVPQSLLCLLHQNQVWMGQQSKLVLE